MLKRRGMTLVEILVVMAIMVMMAAITAAFYPSTATDMQATRFSSTIQAAMVSARNRSKSEKLPTGIRLYRDETTKLCNGVVLIQKPADMYGQNLDPLQVNGIFARSSDITNNINSPARIFMGVLSFYDSLGQPYEMFNVNKGAVLNDGDILKFDNNEMLMVFGPAVKNLSSFSVFQTNGLRPVDSRDIAVIKLNGVVNGVIAYERFASSGLREQPDLSAVVSTSPYSHSEPISTLYSVLKTTGTKNYKIIKQPVEISGDPPFELPEDYQISLLDYENDINAYVPPKTSPIKHYWASNTNVQLLPSSKIPPLVPPETLPSTVRYTDIYFNESGGLQSPINGDIFLWLHRKDAVAGDYSNDLVVAIRKLTGTVGVFPLGNSKGSYPNGMPDPFYLARDPKNQGL